MVTRDEVPSASTVKVVTRLEPVSDSVMTLSWLRLVHRHPVGACAPPGRERETGDGARANSTRLDLEVREFRRQEAVVVLAGIGEVLIDHLGRCLDRPFR